MNFWMIAITLNSKFAFELKTASNYTNSKLFKSTVEIDT